MYKRAQKVRLVIVFCFYILGLLIIVIRLLDIQVFNSKKFKDLAVSQHNLTLTLPAQRGIIYDRNLRMLAVSLRIFSVYAVPSEVKNKAETAAQLASSLDLDAQKILERLNRKKSFVWIKRKLDYKEAEKVRGLKLAGIELLNENKRYYPKGGLACHILGFAGIDELGLEGVELYYDRYLRGKDGKRSLLRDAKQRVLPAFEYEFIPALDGYNLILTIDEVIQTIAEEELDKAFRACNAKGACVVIMDAYTGEIYALANRPAYDLNFFNNSQTEEHRNRAICDFFEPGSTFKIITASAALEENIVSLNDRFFCENGEYKIAGHVLHDHKPHGYLSFVEVIEKSSNIGVAKIAQKIGPEILYRYIEKFKFGKPTGIDLSGETSGMVNPPQKWSKLSIVAIPMGQEICVSVIQLVRAMAVIANGGFLINPHLVRRITDNNNEDIRNFDHTAGAKVISEKTAATMKTILRGVVDNGTARMASVDGYEVAGKTGTAQKIEPGGGYSHNRFIASFIGFAPVDNPRFVTAVILDEPRPLYYGGVVCAPVFKNIMEKVLRYSNTPESKMSAALKQNKKSEN